MNRHGVEYSSQVLGASEKMIASRLERTGAKGPSDQRSISYLKKRATTQKRYGMPHQFLLETTKDKRACTLQERYGCSHANPPKYMTRDQLVEAGQLGYSVQHNKFNRVSKPEAGMRHWLEQRYGNNDVITPIRLNKKLVDFYIQSLNTYVELDGVFWHGLDRPLEQVTNKGILKRYNEDRILDVYCLTEKIKLVRITDLEWNSCVKRDDYSLVVNELEG
jgi:hypothetical protein